MARTLIRVGVGLALITWSAAAYAYRSGADLPELAGTPRVSARSNTIEYVLNEQLPPGMDPRSVANTLRQAFSSWGQVPCSVVEFRDAGSTGSPARQGDGLNTIQWVLEGWAARGFAQDAAAVTDVQYEKQADGTWVIAEADLYLNAESKLWVEAPSASDERDLLSVATHEAGHMLGLLHPCEPGAADGAPDCSADPGFAETTMYPLYEPAQATLSADDVAGACFLYPGSRCEGLGCPEGQTCTPEGCRAECAGSLCEPGQFCTDGHCETPPPPCSGEECPKPGSCTTDENCPSPLRCMEGHCEAGSGAAGDPCASERDCEQGVCSEQGACLATCRFATDCAAGIACVPNQLATTCGAKGLAVGEACNSADDCAGGYCVADVAGSPLCSRACGSANAGCPAGWGCQQIGGSSVCAPPQAEPGGCACSTPSADRSAATPLALALASWVFTACARRRRRRRHDFLENEREAHGRTR